MTTTTKKILLVSAILLGAAGAIYAFRKSPKVKKLVGKLSLSDSEPTTDEGESSIKQGSSGRYVEQLQDFLNDLHKATAQIKKNCGTPWGYFTAWPSKSNGDILEVTGSFDDKTAQVTQFYIARKEVDLYDLANLKAKMSKWKTASDKCVYPLAIN